MFLVRTASVLALPESPVAKSPLAEFLLAPPQADSTTTATTIETNFPEKELKFFMQQD
jgi:hypothetical protein